MGVAQKASRELGSAKATLRPGAAMLLFVVDRTNMGNGKGLAITALALGILGLFTGGLLAVGSLTGLALAGAALWGGGRRAGRDVARAALAANAVALITLLPLVAAYHAYRTMPTAFVDDDSLPEPVQKALDRREASPGLPPPPPAPKSLGRRGPETTAAPLPAAPTLAKQRKTTGPGVAGTAPPEVAPIRVGGEIEEPRKVRNVRPVYPDAAKESRVQGVVVLECTISPQGKVVEVKTLRSVPLLDEAAIEAVRQWEYTPTLLNGVPVPVVMTVTVNFRLN